METAPNVLLVVLDSVRAKNMSLYDYDRETTPFLEKFANRSTLYTQARSPGIHSIASHVSIFTGEHVEEHEAIYHTSRIDTSRTIWEELKTSGYETALFTNNRIISEASNLGDAFGYSYTPHFPIEKRFEESGPLFEEAYSPGDEPIQGIIGNTLRSLRDEYKFKSILNCTHEKLGSIATRMERRFLDPDLDYKTMAGERFTREFLDWESEQDGPWAACVNLMDTHEPYEPQPDFDLWADEESWRIQEDGTPLEELFQGIGWERIEALESLYDGTILQADTYVSDLIDTLERRNVLEETLVIIMSDHGEGFGEHSRVDPSVRAKNHLWGIHEVLTHVPLIIKYPHQDSGDRIEEVVSLTRIPEVIRSVARGESKHYTLQGDDVVLSSTFRLLEKEAAKYDSIGGIDSFVGPWRSVYENHGDSVRKFIQKGDNYLTLDIYGPDEIEIVSREPHTRVRDEYSQLDGTEVLTERTSDIEEDLEGHLKDLGYIR